MTTLDLRRLKLRSGDQYRDEQEIELEPFELGGQRYLPVPGTVPAELTITRASTGTVFELRFDARMHGPCFRCLEDAAVHVSIAAATECGHQPVQDGAPQSHAIVRSPETDSSRTVRAAPSSTTTSSIGSHSRIDSTAASTRSPAS